MKLILHHFRWLTYQLRWWIRAYVVLWGLYGIGLWFIPPDRMVLKLIAIWSWVLPLVGGRIMLSAVWRDRVVGTDGFWRGRPLRAAGLWSAQWLLLLLLALPPLVSWVGNGVILANTPEQWRLGLDDLGFICLPLLIGATLGSFATGASSVAVIIALAGACWVGGGLLFVNYDWVPWLNLGQEGIQYRQMASLKLGLVLSSIVAVIAWARGVVRGQRWVRGIMLGLALLLGPLAAAWLWLENPVERAQALPGKFSFAGHYQPGSQPVRLAFAGLPAGLVPEVKLPDLYLRSVNTTTDIASADLKAFPGRQGGQFLESRVPSEEIKETLPMETQWYLDAMTVPPRPWLVTFPGNSGPWTISGSIRGLLNRQTLLGSLPLAAGSSARHEGTLLQMKTYWGDEAHVAMTVRLYRAVSPRSRMVNEIRQSVSPLPPSVLLIPIAYFPALHLAVVHAPIPWEELSSGLQVRGREFEWQVELPARESSRGLRFTPASLQGAQLLLYENRMIADFNATANEEPISVDIPSALEEKVARLASSEDSARAHAIEKILDAGDTGLRALVAHRWSEAWFPNFAGPLLEHGPDELLLDSLAQDQRWAQLAQKQGLAARVATLLLPELRHSGRKLSPTELLMLLDKISSADYPALSQQVRRLGPGLWRWEDAGPHALLWRALRALPGFDWKSLAREQWQQIYTEDKVCQGIQVLAALTGDATAFNGLAESESLETSAGPEVAELANLVEDLPSSGSEQTPWLQQRWGYFTWDAALGKFRAQR